MLAACGTVMPSREKTAAYTLATRFCTLRQQGSEQELQTLFTPRLAALVAQAKQRSAAMAAASPDAEIPLADGIPYQSRVEDTGCTAGRVQEYGRLSQVDIHYGGGWTDRVLVAPVGPDAWAIDDVLYPPDYQSGLRDAVFQAFD